jgi:5-hydroxyisourate hydrolase-like protein (transthyretin family)
MASVRQLSRTLKRANGTPRKAVLVKLIRETDNRDMWEGSTDIYGKFSMDTATFTDGNYRLEYYGDGIKQTIFQTDGVTVSFEDPVTPWEYDIELKNPTADTRSSRVFNFLVFKKSSYYGEDYDI